MRDNPFSINFGIEPKVYLRRELETDNMISSFLEENPSNHTCLITGVRGSGKTVELTSICNVFKEKKDWIVLELSPEKDILHGICAKLSSRKDLLEIFRDIKFNISILGFGVEIDNLPPVTDELVILEEMLKKLTEKGKKILIAIDEVSDSKYIVEFVSQYQIYLRQKYNIFLIMTGLYENVRELQNKKALTFLYRTPQIDIKPLNYRQMAQYYSQIFSIDKDKANKMAMLTKGYAFAFQILGYICWDKNKAYDEIIDDYDIALEKYSYEKIWSELSSVDKKVMLGICKSNTGKVEEIRDICDMNSNEFTVYRKRLLNKGLIEAISYGYIGFTLPRFKEYIEFNFQ